MRAPSQGGEKEYVIYFSSPPRNGVRIIFLDILPIIEGGLRTRSRLPPPSQGGEEEYTVYSSSPVCFLAIEYVAYVLTPHPCNGGGSLLAR